MLNGALSLVRFVGHRSLGAGTPGIDIEMPDVRTIPAINVALELKRYGAEDAARFLELVGGAGPPAA